MRYNHDFRCRLPRSGAIPGNGSFLAKFAGRYSQMTNHKFSMTSSQFRFRDLVAACRAAPRHFQPHQPQSVHTLLKRWTLLCCLNLPFFRLCHAISIKNLPKLLTINNLQRIISVPELRPIKPN
jgi:hypothetical protein